MPVIHSLPRVVEVVGGEATVVAPEVAGRQWLCLQVISGPAACFMLGDTPPTSTSFHFRLDEGEALALPWDGEVWAYGMGEPATTQDGMLGPPLSSRISITELIKV